MISIDEVNNSIEELENGSTTFSNCEKLASLYIVRNFLGNKDSVVTEYKDILPSYDKYIECKRNYQLNKDSLESVDNAFKDVLREIYEFLDILYVTTESTQERTKIMTMIEEFKKTRN